MRLLHDDRRAAQHPKLVKPHVLFGFVDDIGFDIAILRDVDLGL